MIMSMGRRDVRLRRRWTPALAMLLAFPLTACIEPDLSDIGQVPVEVSPGESRRVELTALGFEVEDFEQTLTLQDLQELPRSTLDDLWLTDLDMRPLTANALTVLGDLTEDEAAQLSPAARNLRYLLTMTPDNAELAGTKLENLIALAASVGIPPAVALADLMGIGITDEIIPAQTVADTFADLLIATHPNAQFRKGPVDDEHPDGLYAVPPGSIPITLADVAFNFEELATRFGPVDDHPGVVTGATGVAAVEEDFAMTVRVDANPLPFKGVDLTDASIASVNSIPAQIENLFDFSDPDWLQIQGLAEDLSIAELTIKVVENDAFVPGGDSQQPTPLGNSPIWELPPWEFEHLIIEAARRFTGTIEPHCDLYELGTGTDAFEACIDASGWTEMTTFNDIGDPPPPAYFWDILVEVAQVRLHDQGLAEGDADAEFTLSDVSVGVPPEELEAQIRTNLEANPAALSDLAATITANTFGDADFFYVRPAPGDADEGDWLFFVTEEDIREDEDGVPVRDYTYAKPGFYAEASLSTKVSSTESAAGDSTHEKVQISVGDVLYLEDDAGRLFQISVIDKPSPRRVIIDVTRAP